MKITSEITLKGVDKKDSHEDLIDRVVEKCFEIENLDSDKVYVAITLTTPENIREIRIEIGPRDIENGQCVVVRRDTLEKVVIKIEELSNKIEELLEEIQKHMYNECVERVNKKTTIATNMDEFEKNLKENQGYVKAMWCGDEACEDKIKELTGAKSRCIPFEQEHLSDKCVCCGKPATKMVYWGRQY